MVCLFQSGTEDVKKAIKADDDLAVFREGSGHELQEVGKVKVLFYTGDDFMKAEVIEGEVRNGDIARNGDATSLGVPIEGRFK